MINAASTLNANMSAIRTKVADVAVHAALDAMTISGIAAIRAELDRSSHVEGTRTTSTPPSPPARVSGHLGDDVIATPAVTGEGYAMTEVGSTAPYARIQEFGGTIHPIKATRLFWIGMGGMHFGSSVTLPARPYLKPAIETIVASGELGQAAADAFLASLIV